MDYLLRQKIALIDSNGRTSAIFIGVDLQPTLPSRVRTPLAVIREYSSIFVKENMFFSSLPDEW